MGRISTINAEQFTICLTSEVSAFSNAIYYSPFHVYTAFNRLLNSQRQSCWKNLSILLNKSQQQVKDFYYNSWVKQFSPDLNVYKSELLLQILCNLNAGTNQKDIARVVSEQFTRKHQEKQFNVKTVNQFVRKLMNNPEYIYQSNSENLVAV
ncbi:Conserved_hypothetical protein [Hexamita inflata]|uniref:Uncharacterized protein n=1 Tax=Hexamita inflata TaxID=28002 RepID=A0AA86RB38_9EUKA|nr:Conserved hypothetical protein [Hexamita inflata]